MQDIQMILEKVCKNPGEICDYYDAYFDTANKDFMKSERELRLRRITLNNTETVWLTFKEPPYEDIYKNKIEHEVVVSSYEDTALILNKLGYSEDISFQKKCVNFRTMYGSLDILVTLVTVGEIERDFIEVEEKTTEAGDIPGIYEVLKEVLFSLQVMPDQLTGEYYTDMVRQARHL